MKPGNLLKVRHDFGLNVFSVFECIPVGEFTVLISVERKGIFRIYRLLYKGILVTRTTLYSEEMISNHFMVISNEAG